MVEQDIFPDISYNRSQYKGIFDTFVEAKARLFGEPYL